MKTKAEHSIIADAIHEWHTVYLPCIRNLSHNALKSYGEGMGIYIDFLESSKGVTSNTLCGECFRKDWIEEWWKSHATLTPLAKQDCPLWLQYD